MQVAMIQLEMKGHGHYGRRSSESGFQRRAFDCYVAETPSIPSMNVRLAFCWQVVLKGLAD